MIPKIIHQVWIGEKPVPDRFIKTWKEKHPGWIHMLWNESILEKHFPDGLVNQKQYDIMPELAGKCDIARYEILNKFGGVFVDADAICVNKLDNFFLDNDSFSCYENESKRGNLIANGYLGSTRSNKLMKLLIKEISLLKSEDLLIGKTTAWQTVGPLFLTRVIHKYAYSCISVYPSYFFIPKHHTGETYNGIGKIYAEQYWGSTPGSSFEGYNYVNLKG